jgi:DNA-binding transcriptional regulator YhcF (GntR family)
MNRRRVITESLRQRIVTGLHLGTVKTGDRLPSVRHLGTELHADPRVILAAYQRLAAEGLVLLQTRSGVFVQKPPRGEAPLPEVASWVVEVFVRGLSRGISPTELRGQARACLETVRVRAACLECNDDQIHALCGQLHDDYGFDTVAVDVDALERREPLPRAVAATDLIVTTRFHSTAAARLARRLRRPLIVATLDPFFVTEVRRMLAQGPVWWICTDARFAAKLPRLFPEAAVKPLVLERDPLDPITPDALVYATRRAAERLPPGWLGGRVMTMSRVFSADTARALLVFLVRRNLEAASTSGMRGNRRPKTS